jgi:hypothetical protein
LISSSIVDEYGPHLHVDSKSLQEVLEKLGVAEEDPTVEIVKHHNAIFNAGGD